MSEKQEVPNQVGKMLGQLVEHQCHFGDMPVQDREYVIRHTPEAIRLIINAMENRRAEVEKFSTPLFSVIATTSLDALPAKPTKLCFHSMPNPKEYRGIINGWEYRYEFRNNDFDMWLPATQPEVGARVITTLGLMTGWRLAEAAEKVVGVGSGLRTSRIGELLIRSGYTMTLAQVEKMVEKTMNGEETGMNAQGYENWFFIETGNPEDPVAAGSVSCGLPRWRADIWRLDYSDILRANGSCLLIPNFDSRIVF